MSNDYTCRQNQKPRKDALYPGPVPAGLSLKRLSVLRSRFWTAGKRDDEFDKRNAHLLTWRQYDEIVLWFGASSLCQLGLAQILAWLAMRSIFPQPKSRTRTANFLDFRSLLTYKGAAFLR